jgi:hypothetical protein
LLLFAKRSAFFIRNRAGRPEGGNPSDRPVHRYRVIPKTAAGGQHNDNAITAGGIPAIMGVLVVLARIVARSRLICKWRVAAQKRKEAVLF